VNNNRWDAVVVAGVLVAAGFDIAGFRLSPIDHEMCHTVQKEAEVVAAEEHLVIAAVDIDRLVDADGSLGVGEAEGAEEHVLGFDVDTEEVEAAALVDQWHVGHNCADSYIAGAQEGVHWGCIPILNYPGARAAVGQRDCILLLVGAAAGHPIDAVGEGGTSAEVEVEGVGPADSIVAVAAAAVERTTKPVEIADRVDAGNRMAAVGTWECVGADLEPG